MTTIGTSHSGAPTPSHVEYASKVVPRYASYVPHDLKYNAEFEDNVMNAVLSSDGAQIGIRIIPDDSNEPAVEGQSVRFSDIHPQSLPNIAEEELPLPLNDTRRVFASPLPGIKLTHPGGYLEGGPGLDPDMDTFPDDFLSSRPQIASSPQLQRALQKEISTSMELLRERLRARQKAKERNEQIEKELKMLTDQHTMELKLHNRMQEEMARKKEAKEKRRREREGG